MHLSCQQRTNQPKLVGGSKELELEGKRCLGSREVPKTESKLIWLSEGRNAEEGEEEFWLLLLGAWPWWFRKVNTGPCNIGWMERDTRATMSRISFWAKGDETPFAFRLVILQHKHVCRWEAQFGSWVISWFSKINVMPQIKHFTNCPWGKEIYLLLVDAQGRTLLRTNASSISIIDTI